MIPCPAYSIPGIIKNKKICLQKELSQPEKTPKKANHEKKLSRQQWPG